MRRRVLKIQKYMSEIAGDAFFWVSFSNFSQPPQFYWMGTPLLYSPYHRFPTQKCQITRSPAFETKHYGRAPWLNYHSAIQTTQSSESVL